MISRSCNIDERQLRGMTAEEILAWAWKLFQPRVAFGSSLGMEDQVLTDLISRTVPDLPVFTLDTGRLFPETYNLIERTEECYALKIRIFQPDALAVEQMVNRHGINLFRQSVELRHHCCFLRKVQPLRRALTGLDAWICGLRREQSITRAGLELVEWDETNNLVKINPLANWSETEVREYVQIHQVPYNPLHDRGFPSIGCACCTRAIQKGEDLRAGRWWWEAPEHRECGLHWKEGRLVPDAAVEGNLSGGGEDRI
jgi:phosphoadenosine phosphosulfate reductase